MNDKLGYIYNQCLANGEHTLTPEGFGLLFPDKDAVTAFLLECKLQSEGVGLIYISPYTFQLSDQDSSR